MISKLSLNLLDSFYRLSNLVFKMIKVYLNFTAFVSRNMQASGIAKPTY